MLNAVVKAQGFVAGISYDDFATDDKTVFAVIRALEVIGEAAKRIPESVRLEFPGLPWRSMSGMRDKLIHEYFGINLRVIWKTVTEEVPALEPELRRVLSEVGE